MKCLSNKALLTRVESCYFPESYVYLVVRSRKVVPSITIAAAVLEESPLSTSSMVVTCGLRYRICRPGAADKLSYLANLWATVLGTSGEESVIGGSRWLVLRWR